MDLFPPENTVREWLAIQPYPNEWCPVCGGALPNTDSAVWAPFFCLSGDGSCRRPVEPSADGTVADHR